MPKLALSGVEGGRRPRILFLADRNILANQAFKAFSAFPEDTLVRIKPNEIRKSGKVPTNGSIFFTIFQTFMSGDKNSKSLNEDNESNRNVGLLKAASPNRKQESVFYFGQYPKDYFDLIIVDECHRGGAKEVLGDVLNISSLFVDFQKYLYVNKVA